MKRIVFLFIFSLLCTPKLLQAQNVNQFKYVIVPIKYDFLSENDQYKLNSLTEFLFEKYGFTAILEGEEFPEDLIDNRCSALTADVLSDTGAFSLQTKVKVVLKDCNQQLVFESKEGRSKLKDYNFSYQEALREAFSSVKALNYSYSGPTKNTVPRKEVEKISPVEKSQTPKTNLVLYKGKTAYFLKKQENGYLIKDEKTQKIIANLNQTSRGDYIFRSQNANGTAYFDESGNLTVEYFDVEEGEMKKEVYLIKN